MPAIEIVLGRRLELNPWAGGLAMLALFYVNYYVLVVRRNGIAFEKKFNSFPKSKRIILRLTAAGIFLAALIAFFFITAAYHRAFGIVPPS